MHGSPTADGMQTSLVQALPSSQVTTLPPVQLPPLHASPVVQALPSSHALVLFACEQPVPGSQMSSVQGLSSSHEPIAGTAGLQSQVSPAPSPSVSAWSVLQRFGQLSHASPTPSPSRSRWSAFATCGQLSASSPIPSPSASGGGTCAGRT